MTFYDLLGVTKEATPSEIKKSYKKKAQALHPDKLGGETSAEFIALQKAYDTLKDPAKREHYDTYGVEMGGTAHLQIHARLADLFNQLIEQEVYGDLIEAGMTAIRNNQSQIAQHLRQVATLSTACRKKLGRVSCTEADNLYEQLLNQKIQQLLVQESQLLGEERILTALLTELSKYKDTAPVTRPPSTVHFYTQTGTSL